MGTLKAQEGQDVVCHHTAKEWQCQATQVIFCLPESKPIQWLSHSLSSHIPSPPLPHDSFLLSQLPQPHQMHVEELLLAWEGGLPDFGQFPHGNPLTQVQDDHRLVQKGVGGPASHNWHKARSGHGGEQLRSRGPKLSGISISHS